MSIEYTEKENEHIKEYCESNSLKEDDVKAIVEKKYMGYVSSGQLLVEDDPELTHERRMARAIRAGQGYFRKYLKKLNDAKPGMLICRHRTVGFDQFQIDVAKRYVDEHGREKAIEDKYMNEAGKYLYTSGDKTGKPIDRPNSFTNITGYITTVDAKGNKYHDLRCFSVNEKEIHKIIPVCQYSKIAAGEGNKQREGYPHSDKNLLFYNGGMVDSTVEVPYDEESFLDIITTWNDVIDEMHFCSDFTELLNFGEEYCNVLSDKNNEHVFDFCIVPGICSEILVNNKTKDEDLSLPSSEQDWNKDFINREVNVTIINPETYDMHDITIFASYDAMQGLAIDDGMQGLFVLQAFKNKEDDQWCRWHLGGFLPADDMIDLGKLLSDSEGE